MTDPTSVGDIIMNSVMTSSVYGLTERMMFLSVFLPFIFAVVFIFFTPFGGDVSLVVRFFDAFCFDAFFAVFFFMVAPCLEPENLNTNYTNKFLKLQMRSILFATEGSEDTEKR
jgi:hypothetical protein